MNEDAMPQPSPAAAADGATAGALLRQAREAAGLHVAALAVAIKVPVRKLEALEADHLHQLPDAVFVRALASTICRTLKVDAAPILARLPQTVVPRLDPVHTGVRMPRNSGATMARQPIASLISRPTMLVVAALLLATLALVLIPEARNTVNLAARIAMPEATTLAPAEPAVPMAAVMLAGDKPAAAGGPAAGASAAVTEAAKPAVSDAPYAAPVALIPAQTIASVPPAATPSVVQAAGILLFKAREQAWVRVRDAQGSIQLEKTLAAGETAQAGGAAPLAVVLGNAGATEVLLRGQPYGLEGVTQNNVARFEVK